MPKGTVVRLPHTAGGRKPGPHRAASGTCVLLRLSTLSVFAGHPGTAQLTLHVTQTWAMARVGHRSYELLLRILFGHNHVACAVCVSIALLCALPRVIVGDCIC